MVNATRISIRVKPALASPRRSGGGGAVSSDQRSAGRLVMDRYSAGQPVDQHLDALAAEGDRDPAAARAAVGIEADGADAVAQRLLLGGVERHMTARRHWHRGAGAGRAIEAGGDV